MPKTTILTAEQMKAHMKYTVFSPTKAVAKIEEGFTNLIKPVQEPGEETKSKLCNIFWKFKLDDNLKDE